MLDSHIHLFDPPYAGTYGPLLHHELSVYEHIAEAHGISGALVVGYEGEERYAGNNTYIRTCAAQRPWLRTVAYLDPLNATAATVDGAMDAGHVGVALYVTPASAVPFSAASDSFWSRLGTRGSVVSVNASPRTLVLLDRQLSLMEGATVLVSHLGSPGPGWSTSPSVAAFLGLAEHHSHLSVKLSGLHASANPDHDYPYAPLRGWISDLLEAFGPDRLLWGSNFPVALELCSFPQCISAVEELPWSEADRIAVMGGNLERILRAVQSTPN